MPSVFSGLDQGPAANTNICIIDVQKYLDTYFADLKSTTDRLQPLTLDTCQQANP
ncbi:CSS-motif domain-containing protein [Escherichia coli]